MTTSEILTKLRELAPISGELDPTAADKTQLFRQIEHYSNHFLSTLPGVKGFYNKPVGDLSIKGEKHTFEGLLNTYQQEVVENGINAASPKHLGYIPGGGVYVSALADYLAAITNPFASAYFASPGAATMENEVVNWLKTVFSFPESAVGCLTSGGSVSNLIAFTAARDKHGVKNEKILKSVVYLSEQVHHSAQKALRIIGLEDVVLRTIPLDEHFKMCVSSLKQAVIDDKQQGLHPFLVIGTAGTTDTGVVDPLDAIADIAEANNMWFHVDGAYGGFFILTSQKDLFRGISRADSLIIDPHKGLFMPYGVAAVLVKDAESVLHSHYYTANYMQDGYDAELVLSPANLSPELTKHFRGLRVWLPLQYHGIEAFTACLEEKLLLTHYMRNELEEKGFCVGPEPDLSVSYFWYPFEGDVDAKNRALMHEVHNDGSVFLSSSVIGGRFVIRIAILAFRTKKETIDEALAMLLNCVEKVK